MNIFSLITLFSVMNLSFPGAAIASGQSSNIQIVCRQIPKGNLMHLRVIRNSSSFKIEGSMNQSVSFSFENQRPSLGVRTADRWTTAWREYLDFNPSGLEVIPVEKAESVQFERQSYRTSLMLLSNKSGKSTFDCPVSFEGLRNWLGIRPHTSTRHLAGVKAVGFDIDDTLLFTTPAFERASATGGKPDPKNFQFWGLVNSCDPGCPSDLITLPNGTRVNLPANSPSQVKRKALELVRYHQKKGHRVYAITARVDVNGDVLRNYLARVLGIPKAQIYFEPDLDQPGNPKGKTDLIEKLNLDIFYGDSDSDITDALKAFHRAGAQPAAKSVIPVRFLRSPYSNNRKGNELNKYHPGYYGEMILEGSY